MLPRNSIARRVSTLLRLRPNARYYADQKLPPASRLARVESRLPKFLRRFTTPLRTAPVSHITAFILLHELTAVVPLFGLAGFFHYTNWLPPYISEGEWVKSGIEIFGKWMRKRGWIDEDASVNRRTKWWGTSETGVRVVVELATAWALVKMMLPLRLVVSVWMTPWFARWTVLPVTRKLGRMFGRGKKQSPAAQSSAGGTGAVGAGTLPKEGKSK